MSMPKVPDINPEISISRQDALNIIIASIAMEELSLAHILNAEGEKLQYVLGTLENCDPGEVTICDIMEVNKSVHRTLRDVIKEEMLLQLKLEDVAEMSEGGDECQLTIRGEVVWRDGDNMADTRPVSVDVALLRDGEVYKTVTVHSAGDCKFVFPCLPVWKDSECKYSYQIDEQIVPTGYTKTISGYNIINTVEPGEIMIAGTKTWIDNNNIEGDRPAEIDVHLLQNGVQLLTTQVTSPPDVEDTATFNFPNVPQFDDQGRPFAYTLDEQDIANYSKKVDGFILTNTHILIP